MSSKKSRDLSSGTCDRCGHENVVIATRRKHPLCLPCFNELGKKFGRLAIRKHEFVVAFMAVNFLVCAIGIFVSAFDRSSIGIASFEGGLVFSIAIIFLIEIHVSIQQIRVDMLIRDDPDRKFF